MEKNTILLLYHIEIYEKILFTMRDHLSSVVILSLIYKSLARSESGVFRYYIENSEFIDKVFSAQPIIERGPVTYIECPSKCKRCCAWFSFNTVTNQCRVYQTCDAGNVNGMEAGWKYFLPNKIGKHISYTITSYKVNCICIFIVLRFICNTKLLEIVQETVIYEGKK